MDERQIRITNIIKMMQELEQNGVPVNKLAYMMVRRDYDKYSHMLDNDIISAIFGVLSGVPYVDPLGIVDQTA